MHSWTSPNNTTFNFDGGFDGDLLIRRGTEEMILRCDEVVELVAHYYIQPRLIAELEDASADKLLGLASHD